MSVNERRAEIMKILVARRQTTVPLLAQELCVCCNTVRNDIHVLALDYPLETCSGNGGGVRVLAILWEFVPGPVHHQR